MNGRRYDNPVPMRKMQTPKREAEDDVPQDLTDKAVRDLRVVFASFQNTNSGIITVSQLADIVELLGETRPDISVLQKLLAKISDKGENANAHVIDFKRFLRFFVCHLYGGNVKVRSKEVFSAFDSDTNASVTAQELQESLTTMGMSINQEEALAMTSVADGSIEGEVNYQEFKQICRRLDSDISLCLSLPKNNNSTNASFMMSPAESQGEKPHHETVKDDEN